MRAQVASSRGGSRPIEGPSQPSHSVLSALDVLCCFEYDEDLGVTEIARRLGIAKSTAHRLLTALSSRGFIERSSVAGQYRLGMQLYELGQLAQDRLEVRHLALPILERVRIATGQTVHLSTGSAPDVVFLERLQTLPGIPLLGERHRRMPMHTTSAGKVLAAFDAEAAAVCEREGLHPMTENSIRDVRTWRATLGEIRKRGYVFSDSENRPGLASVAAPVMQASGTARYAVSVAGPSDVIARQVDSIARLLTQATQRISTGLAR